MGFRYSVYFASGILTRGAGAAGQQSYSTIAIAGLYATPHSFPAQYRVRARTSAPPRFTFTSSACQPSALRTPSGVNVKM
jgi:hypothetical protein